MLPSRLRNHLLFPMILPVGSDTFTAAGDPSQSVPDTFTDDDDPPASVPDISFRPAVQVKRSRPAVRTMLPYQADPRQNSHYKYFLSAPPPLGNSCPTCFLCQKPDRKFQSTFFRRSVGQVFPEALFISTPAFSLLSSLLLLFFSGRICLFLPWGSAHPVPCQVPRVFFLPCIPLFIYLFIFHFMFLILRAFPSRVSYMPLHRRI